MHTRSVAEAERPKLIEVEFDPFAAVELARTCASTEAQREIWTAAQMGDEASAAFNESVCLRLEGELDREAFVGAMQELVSRHEALRMTLSTDGMTLCVAARLEISVPLVDLSELSPREREARVRALLSAEVETPFRLEQGPLFRTQLVRLLPREHLATFTAHHIVCDGWSMAVLLRDLGALYSSRRGKQVQLTQAPSFSAYAEEERSFEATEAYAAAERYWLERFAHTPPALELPLDSTRPQAKSYSSFREDFVLDFSLIEPLKKLGARHGASFFTTLLAGFSALLARLSGQSDIVIGIPAAGQAITGQLQLVGHCVSTLPLRITLDADQSLGAFLRCVRSVMLDAYEHQRCTFGALLKKLSLPRDPSRLPLVSVLFNVEQAVDGDALALDGLRVEFRSNPRSFENFEIFINAAETKRGVVLECQFNTDLFDRETIQCWLSAYEELLRGCLADDARSLDAIAIVPAPERNRLVYEWNATFAEFPRQLTIHRLLEEEARHRSDRLAIRCQDESLAWSELDARANRVAHRLRELGVRRDKLVGLCVSRSLDMLVGMLGILKAGGAYVPLDPAFPRERLAFMLENAGIDLLVLEDRLAPRLPAHGARSLCFERDAETLRAQSSVPLAPGEDDACPESLAYVIFTSGSTGKPKGVCVPHRAVVNFLTSMAREPGLGEHDVLLAVTTLSFDIHVLELLLPLLVGARLVVATREDAADGALLRSRIHEHRVNVMQATPSTWRLLLAAGFRPPPDFKVLCGGEALARDLATELARYAGSVWNMYGPTETTVWSTCHRLSKTPERILIGKPIANTSTYVLDARMQPVPVGVPGELYVGGDGVALGYLNRADLTQERFVPDPFSAAAGTRLYKTGDIVRYLPDGNLEHLGRADSQVKLRGYRIELGEVETNLSRAPGVRQALVEVCEVRPGDTRLVGFVVAEPGANPEDAQLTSHLRASLPEYMLPQHFVRLNELPLLPNGKSDRKALRAPWLQKELLTREHVAPRGQTEAAIAGAFAFALGVRRVSVEDNFFALGGHSLLAAQALSHLQTEHGIVLPLRKLFEAPTPAGLARLVEDAPEATAAPAATRIARRAEAGPAPLSLMQQRLWVLEQFNPGLAVQNLPSAFRLRGELDVPALERAINEIATRHEPIRTTLRWNGDDAVQEVRPELTFALVPLIDVSDLPAPEREAKLLEQLVADSARPFDLGAGPLVRTALYRLGPQEHVFFWLPHHAIWDGWSFDVFLSELDVLYGAFSKGQAAPLPALPIRYQDFAAWQRQSVPGAAVEPQLAFWLKQLEGELPALELPTDRPRPARLSHRGQTEEFVLSKAEIDALTALGRSADATLYMVLLAAFKVMLYRYSRQTDLLVGTPVRGRTLPETENLLGFFVNTLVLRTGLADDPGFFDLLRRVRATVLDAFSHQDMPFELLVQELQVRRDPSRTPIFQAFFTYQDVSKRVQEIGNLRYSQIHVHAPVAPTDMYLWVKETGQGLVGGIDYATDLFDRTTIVRFLKQFRHLLGVVCKDARQPISRLSILPEAERRAILDVNPGAAPFPSELGLHQLFEQSARRSPHRIAITCGDESLSYAELDARAGRLAGQLAALGAGPGTLVGVFVERSLDMLVAILGVLKAGAAYVPLDPSFPRERLSFMAKDAGLIALITQRTLQAKLPTHEARVLLLDELPAQELGPISGVGAAGEQPAYVIYTSGSTGNPKGVVVPHRAVVNFLSGAASVPGIAETDALLAVTTLSFDIHVLELLLPLTAGAKVIVATREDATDGDRLLALIRASGATMLQATPATWRMLLAAGLRSGELDKVLVGGEALPKDLATSLAALSPSAWNMYGPTETTVWSTCAALRLPVERVTIGGPLQNTRVYVLDPATQLCPIGVPGELFIGGDSVASGYLNRSELTCERFLDDAFAPGARVYRTGDLVRLSPDGSLEYIRRNDHQVKLRGHRIELGEIESALLRHGVIREAVALVREDRPGDARLLAYLVTEPARDVTDSELRAHLRGFLPDYMLPQHFSRLPALPRTPNGKVDRNALPAPFAVERDEDAYAAPTTEHELLLAEIWRRVLGTNRVSAHDNFFAIGGHSLLSLRAVVEIEHATGVRLSPTVLLLNSLSQVAAQLASNATRAVAPAPRAAPNGAAAAAKHESLVERLFRRTKQRIRGT
jgi:amino acid adenylation domain-containing protein